MRKTDRKIKPIKIFFLIILIFSLSIFLIIFTTPLHEFCHVIMSSIDPSLQVLEFHPFGTPQISDNYILPSMLGYVVVGETYPGSFNDRSIWADMLQEIICITLQVILTCILIVITLRYLFVKKPNILF